jgi:transcription-repair coupling factor (superfamily II helicase)
MRSRSPRPPPSRYLGLYGPGRAWLAAKLQQSSAHILIINKSRRSNEEMLLDLNFFADTCPVLDYQAWDTLPFELVSPQAHIAAARLATLFKAKHEPRWIICSTPEALLQRVLPYELLAPASLTLSARQPLSHTELLKALQRAQYRKVSLVEDVSEMAVHGAVIDFFPADQAQPVRAEFEAGILKELRSFSAESQRSLGTIESCQILPVRESADSSLELAEERLSARAKQLEVPPRELAVLMDSLRKHEDFPGQELLQAVLHPLVPALQWLPSDTLVLINDQIGVEQAADSFQERIEERSTRLASEQQFFPEPEQLFLSWQTLQKELTRFACSYIDPIEVVDSLPTERKQSQALSIQSASNIELVTKLKTKIGTGDAFAPLGEAINRWRLQGWDVALVVGSAQRAERLHNILLDLNLDARPLALKGLAWLEQQRRYPLVLLEGQLTAGIQLPNERAVFVSESEVFAERSYRKTKRAKTNIKKLLGALAQLQEGDLVVHTDYGVGIYHGLSHREVEGAEGDFLQIEYADSRLFLPVQSIGKVQKYVAAEGAQPQLDKLGSTRWARTKEKVKQAVIPLAGDLIRLYATRSVAKGWRFEPVGAEDERFADNFPFEETSDQRKAIDESLSDMASDRPMDRLVCGDVGFGKTEVALRAAFKCVQHARQVVVLVPTTILVEQHKHTFQRRFNGYPVQVAAVSRLHGPKHNRAILDKLALGEIDIIIGTHRLLQRDVVFKDLGLVIVDEEHRFGVKHKEQLKALKKQVDVLTLTATPIPRTLHMSLLGIRDISVIATPPNDRRVIRTYIATSEELLVRDAILRELQRNGQIYYLHNRVQSIAGCCDRLRLLVPEARFEFAHGQMEERQLEKIMLRFINGDFDVLICTTIVESGLDIPNANTIIIERADTFGLAQLYQLRGRVGRSTRQAYCYFLVPKANKLNSEAQQRLKALQSLDDLGLGFNLALRDMEIRGAGNLLGKEQSGNVLAVGFDLYSRILKEAVLQLKGEELDFSETIEPEIQAPFNAYIPEEYIPEVSERLLLYQRLAALASDEEAAELSREIDDRYGNPPREVYHLVDLMRLRSLLRKRAALRLELTPNKLLLSFSPRAAIDPAQIMRLLQRNPDTYRFSRQHALSISAPFDKIAADPARLYSYVHTLLNELRAG